MTVTTEKLRDDIEFAKARLYRDSPMRAIFIAFFYSVIGFGLSWKADAPHDVIIKLGVFSLERGFAFSGALFLLFAFVAYFAGHGFAINPSADYERSMAGLMQACVRGSQVIGGGFGFFMAWKLQQTLSQYQPLPGWQIYVLCVFCCGLAGMSVGGLPGLIGVWSGARSTLRRIG